MADPSDDQVQQLLSRSQLTIKRLEGPQRPRVASDQIVIWRNTTADDVRLLFRVSMNKVYEISGSYEV